MISIEPNLLYCLLTAIAGAAAIYAFKQTGIKIVALIMAFWLCRIFAARAWVNITGSIFELSTEPAYWLFLAITIFSMSFILIVPTRRWIEYRWHDIGWTLDAWKLQLLSAIPALMLMGMLVFSSTLANADPKKMLASALFSFLIASWQEEVIFRGHLMAWLDENGVHGIVAILLQAAIFSIAHIGFAPTELLLSFLFSAMLLGVIFGAIRHYSGGQLGGFLLHGMINFMSLSG